jgi:hypothetical protein
MRPAHFAVALTHGLFDLEDKEVSPDVIAYGLLSP